MANSRNGSSTIIKASRLICRMVGTYGVFGLSEKTDPAFVAAVNGLVVACNAFTALDDFPGQVDRSAPYTSEDTMPVG